MRSRTDPEGRLEPFDIADAASIAGWAIGSDEVRRWCSSPIAPVPASVVAGWSSADDVDARVLVVDGLIVAYGELWIDREENEVELAHLIVDPRHRGRGLGRTLVESLTARSRRHGDEAFLRVLPDNVVAISCYTAAGFEPVAAARRDEWNRGQPADYVWMVR